MGEPILRNWLYRSGDIFLPRKYVDKLDKYIIGNDTSVMYLNYWSLMHLLSGVLFPSENYLYYFIVHSLWELWQIFIGMTPLNLRGFIDIIVDTLMGLLGMYLKNIATKGV